MHIFMEFGDIELAKKFTSHVLESVIQQPTFKI